MGSKLQLKVTEPCHENWDNMTPDDKGRFCGACQKQVVDFSVMSDRELVQFFKKPSAGSVCGRFMNDQLERPLEMQKKRIPWFRYFFQIMLPALFVSEAGAQRTTGKPVQLSLSDTTKNRQRPGELIMGLVVRRPQLPKEMDTATKNVPMIKQAFIQGRVTDQQGLPVPYASIDPGNGLARAADENGAFVLDTTFIKNGHSIRISAVSFEPRTIIINKENDLREGILIKLEPRAASLPEAVITSHSGYTKGYVVMGNVSESRKVIKEPAEIPVPAPVRKLILFPNPVITGTSLHISFDKMKEGYYQLAIYSYSGQLIQQKEIWIDSGARVLSLELPVTAAGNYLLSMINKDSGEKIGERFVVVQ